MPQQLTGPTCEKCGTNDPNADVLSIDPTPRVANLGIAGLKICWNCYHKAVRDEA